jgi:signal peptidase I
MEGNPNEADETGDTEIFPRYGRGSGMYADEVEDTGSLPRRSRGVDSYPTARWGEPGPDEWNDPDREADRDPPGNGGHFSYGNSSYAQPYQPPTYPYQPPPPAYEAAPYAQAPYEPPIGQTPFERDPLPRPVSGGWGSVSTGYGQAPEAELVESDNLPVPSFGRRPETEDRPRLRRAELLPARAKALVSRRRPAPRDEDDEDARPVARARRVMPLWQELPLLLVVAFCLAVLIRTFLLQAFFIPSGSMEQTLLVGDRVLVNKIVYDVRPPERGEVVVFKGTDNWAPENFGEPSQGLLGRISGTLGDLVGVSRPGEKDFIKRVIGVPGDRISCCDPSGRIYVNGRGIDEPYVINNSPEDVPPDPRVCRSRRFDEVLVPPGQLFVMGDHRIVSQDSRCQGTVPIENVIGRAFVVVWPTSRWDTLSVPATFEDVPGPVALGPPQRYGSDLRLGAAVVTLPILASLVVTTRSGRKPRWGRRTLLR